VLEHLVEHFVASQPEFQLQNNWKVYHRCIGWLCYMGDVLEDEDEIKWI